MKENNLPRTVAFYRSLLAQPMPVGSDVWLRERAQAHLNQATVFHGGRTLIHSAS